MLIKQIYDEYGLPIERIINKEYKRLGLKLPEAMVLLALFSIYERRRTFTINAISKRVEYNRNEIGLLIASLEEKGFLELKLETNKDGKEREIFSLDQTFKKIEKLIIDDYRSKKSDEAAAHIGKIIQILEQALGRVLSAFEMELIRNWYLNDNLSYEMIEDEVIKATSKAKFSIKYIDRILMTSKTEDREVDPKTADILEQIYKKI
ncbi:MAG: DnaD domain protein [Acholeplasmataceae bacterium]|jgi:DNA replication protein